MMAMLVWIRCDVRPATCLNYLKDQKAKSEIRQEVSVLTEVNKYFEYTL